MGAGIDEQVARLQMRIDHFAGRALETVEARLPLDQITQPMIVRRQSGIENKRKARAAIAAAAGRRQQIRCAVWCGFRSGSAHAFVWPMAQSSFHSASLAGTTESRP